MNEIPKMSDTVYQPMTKINNLPESNQIWAGATPIATPKSNLFWYTVIQPATKEGEEQKVFNGCFNMDMVLRACEHQYGGMYVCLNDVHDQYTRVDIPDPKTGKTKEEIRKMQTVTEILLSPVDAERFINMYKH